MLGQHSVTGICTNKTTSINQNISMENSSIRPGTTNPQTLVYKNDSNYLRYVGVYRSLIYITMVKAIKESPSFLELFMPFTSEMAWSEEIYLLLPSQVACEILFQAGNEY